MDATIEPMGIEDVEQDRIARALAEQARFGNHDQTPRRSFRLREHSSAVDGVECRGRG